VRTEEGRNEQNGTEHAQGEASKVRGTADAKYRLFALGAVGLIVQHAPAAHCAYRCYAQLTGG
jgi:hypothetical protein